MVKVPLNQRVVFKTMLQKQNRLQVPKLVRWQYKPDSSEILKVTVDVTALWGARESFFARMYKNGRIRIPNLTYVLLKRNERNKQSLEGYAKEVTLELHNTTKFDPFLISIE